MLVCPKCGCEYTFVVESRKDTHEPNMSGYIRRRRECEKCGERFTTYEMTKDDYNTFLQFKRILTKAGYEKRS